MDITEDNLEEFLSYDDLFLDYFNAFLALPVFPQPLYYDRLTGVFHEVRPSHATSASASVHATLNLASTPAPYGATDDEREHMMTWAKKERLPLFCRTKLYRELKLQKLLLKPLQIVPSSAHPSNIRGYSRLSESFLSSLSGSGSSSDEDEESSDEENINEVGEWTGEAQRAMHSRRSRGLSETESFVSSNMDWLPDDRRISLDFSRNSSQQHPVHSPQSILKMSRNRKPKTQGEDSGLGTEPVTRDVTFRRDNTLVSIDENAVAKSVKWHGGEQVLPKTQDKKRVRILAKRAISAPVSYEEFMKGPKGLFDSAYGEDELDLDGEKLVDFQGDIEQPSENEVRDLEGQLTMSFQQMKELLLQSIHGMTVLKDYMENTTGEDLLNFWLDCERVKDSGSLESAGTQRTRIFRDLQDKYRLRLTPETKAELLRAAAQTKEVTSQEMLLLKLQYDVLRRLRAYWLPRFLLHVDRQQSLQQDLRSSQEHLELPTIQSMSSRGAKPKDSFLPSISLAHSMPVNPEEMLHLIRTQTWAGMSSRGVQSRVQSAHRSRVASPRSSLTTPQRNIRDFLVLALSADRDAGGPFFSYLQRHGSGRLLSSLLLWQEVRDYEQEEARLADRLLRLCHAWSIFNQYLAPTSPANMGLPMVQQEKVMSQLLKASDYISVAVFEGAMQHVVNSLEEPWVTFIKQDWKNFLDCESVRSVTPPATIEEIEVTVEQRRIIVRRPWVAKYPESTTSERARRLRRAIVTADNISAERLAEKKLRALEERRAMERERKKAVKAAYGRAKQQKKQLYLQQKMQRLEDQGLAPEEGAEGEEKEEGGYRSYYDDNLPSADSIGDLAPQEEKPPAFKEMYKNKSVMLAFKRHVTDYDSKDKLFKVNMWCEVQGYLDTPDSKHTRSKKEFAAKDIYKMYIDLKGRRHITMPDRVYERLAKEKTNPAAGTLKLCQNFVAEEVESTFLGFWKVQLEEYGDNKAVVRGLQQGALAIKMEGDTSMLKGWNKKGGKGSKVMP